MTDLDKLIKQHLKRQELLPGIATGRFEQTTQVDKAEFRSTEDSGRRDNRINIRISGKDLTELQKLALAEGIPTQSLIANVIHQYVQGTLVDLTRPAVAVVAGEAAADHAINNAVGPAPLDKSVD